jgi:hypothetical protein
VLASITAEAVQKATTVSNRKEPPALVEPTSPVVSVAAKPVAVRPRHKSGVAHKKAQRAKASTGIGSDENPASIEPQGQVKTKKGKSKTGSGSAAKPRVRMPSVIESDPLEPVVPVPPKKTKLVKRKKTGTKSAFKSIHHETDADPTEV